MSRKRKTFGESIIEGLQELLDVLENGESLESKFVVYKRDMRTNTEPTTRSIMNPIPHNWNIGGGFAMT